MVQLIISEKPSSCLKIAEALADKKLSKNKIDNVTYYELEHKGKKILVGCAVGHLYNLEESNKKGWTYPVFDIEWKPSYKISKSSLFTKKYLDVLKKLGKEADEFYNGCDVDIEGELIFKNILTKLFNKKDAKRMHFSTLTKKELSNAYENASPHIDFNLAEAGSTRHFLDHFYGINLSRALTLSIKNSTGMHKILSSGRVQGPTLKILADKEREIKIFKSVPFWQIELKAEIKNEEIIALHQEDKFWEKKKAEKSFNNTKGKKAIVESIERKEFFQNPPNPFDLTSLQLEAYRTLRISPKETLDIAQNLYTNSYISYPRTSSNQLPESLNYEEIISNLAKQSRYKNLAEEILKGKLKPNNGNKTDPAHPAIYPTGEIPKDINDREYKLYDLIVKRTLATFSTQAKRETITIKINVNDEIFVTNGTRTVEKGWHKFYEPYVMLKEQELPEVNRGDELKIIKISILDKETQPPKRYTPASIIKELEKRGLGTKATRAQIIETLYERDYVKEKSLEVTNLGMKTIETLEKYCPEILDEKLTRHFEEEMELIMENKKKGEEILEEAKEVLTKTLNHFKENEKKIGKELSEANIETRDKANTVGKCPNCSNNLRIMYSKSNKSYFIGCSSYPECKTTFSVPKNALPKPTDNLCSECGSPVLNMIRKGKRPYQFCLNPNCKLKEEYRKKLEEEANALL
ncbi:DNA topoisomerase I [Candidatus Woesearchaeota archaeon]|nr:DNA topoisomerase I [Candidatus Woesearchaeota archaeon]